MSTEKKSSKKATKPASAPAPQAPAPAASTDGETPLKFRAATPAELENVPAKGSNTRGLQVQVIAAIKDLPIRGGIVVEEDFKRVRRVVSRINLKKWIPGKHFYVREHEATIYVIRES